MHHRRIEKRFYSWWCPRKILIETSFLSIKTLDQKHFCIPLPSGYLFYSSFLLSLFLLVLSIFLSGIYNSLLSIGTHTHFRTSVICELHTVKAIRLIANWALLTLLNRVCLDVWKRLVRRLVPWYYRRVSLYANVTSRKRASRRSKLNCSNLSS